MAGGKRDYYEVLGVEKNADDDTLKKAYRNLSLELHPDKNKSPEAPEQFQRVKHAFDVLLNPDTRQIYDRLGDAGVKVSAQTVPGSAISTMLYNPVSG